MALVKQWAIDIGLLLAFLVMMVKAQDNVTRLFILAASLALGVARWWAERYEKKQKHKTS